MRVACACKRYMRNPDNCDIVRDGKPVCSEECLRAYDAAKLRERVEDTLSHGTFNGH